jgi:hypothetical protein
MQMKMLVLVKLEQQRLKQKLKQMLVQVLAKLEQLTLKQKLELV